MRVFVTGSTGFVGFHTTKALLDAGHNVRLLVRDLDKAERVLGPVGLGQDDFVVGDMADASLIEEATLECDAVVHSAAGVSVTSGTTDFRLNVSGTHTVVGQAIARDLPCVYLSSLEAIMVPGQPTTETSEITHSNSHYGRSKGEAEKWIRARQAEGAKIASVYPSGVVGPDDPGLSESVRAYRSFLRGTLGVGATQVVDARDLATLIVRLLESTHVGPVLAAGPFLRWTEINTMLASITGAKISSINAPGWLLRFAARTMDVIGAVTKRQMPMTGEGVAIATLWQEVPDSAVVSELGVEWRPTEETLRDMFTWFVQVGRLPAKAVPKLGK